MFLVFRETVERVMSLEREESDHIRSLRLAPGDPVLVGDGIASRHHSHLSSDRKRIELSDEPPIRRIEPVRILFTAVPSGKRWDWLIQKGVELGATHFVPVRFARSKRHGISEGRLNRIIVEAASQSHRFFLPQMVPEIGLDAIDSTIEQIRSSLERADGPVVPQTITPVVFHFQNDSPLRSEECRDGCAFLVGPEGGFDSEEVALFHQRGYRFRGLGENILRIETAALAALAIAGVAGG